MEDLITTTSAESIHDFADRLRMKHAVEEIPVVRKETHEDAKRNARKLPYEGKHEKDKAVVYDEIMDEIVSDRNARLRKFEQTHYVRNDGKSIHKDKRKANYSRKIRYFDRDLDDRFPNKGKSMYMTIQKYRDDMAESVRRDDYDAEINPAGEHHVGKTTLQKQIDRKYAELQKIKTDFCEKNFLHPAGDDYAVTAQFGFVVFYPNEFYQKKWELQELELKQKKAYQRKLDRGNKYMRKYVIDEVTA